MGQLGKIGFRQASYIKINNVKRLDDIGSISSINRSFWQISYYGQKRFGRSNSSWDL